MAHFYEQLADTLNANQPFVLALISGVKGSSPQRKGAKALFFPDGTMAGTLGGGCLEAEVHARAKKARQTGEAATFEMVLDHDFGWDDGLICGGSVQGVILPRATEAAEIWRTLAETREPRRWGVKKDFSIVWVEENSTDEWLYQETVSPQPALWIAGSGHVAQAVAPLALKLDFEVTVFDDRPGLAESRILPGRNAASRWAVARAVQGAVSHETRVRPDCHPRSSARRAGVKRMDSSPVRISRHDRQQPEIAHHPRAVSQSVHCNRRPIG